MWWLRSDLQPTEGHCHMKEAYHTSTRVERCPLLLFTPCRLCVGMLALAVSNLMEVACLRQWWEKKREGGGARRGLEIAAIFYLSRV